ncbi:MAG: hypothetical protein CSA75_00170, partial [Sorangium cellulosum]
MTLRSATGSVFAAVVTAVVTVACSNDGRAPSAIFLLPQPDTRPQEGDASLLDTNFPSGPPGPDAAGYCGNQFFRVSQEPPNLYFVLDRSRSMLDKVGLGSSTTKYAAVRKASIDVVVTFGSRANVGAAVFPGEP